MSDWHGHEEDEQCSNCEDWFTELVKSSGLCWKCHLQSISIVDRIEVRKRNG